MRKQQLSMSCLSDTDYLVIGSDPVVRVVIAIDRRQMLLCT